MKILIAEDEAISRKVLKTMLMECDYEVVVTCNGAEAWQVLQASDAPRLAVLDWMMSETRNIKVIAMTSFAMAGDREKILRAGFDGYISKPIDTRKLPEIVKRYLEKVKSEKPEEINETRD